MATKRTKKTKAKTQAKKTAGRRPGLDIKMLAENPDADASSLTENQRDRLITLLLARTHNGDRGAQDGLSRRLKEFTSVNDEDDTGGWLWYLCLDSIEDEITRQSLPVLKACANSNSPSLVSEAVKHMCPVQPAKPDDPLYGLRELLNCAIMRHDFAEKGDSEHPEDRMAILGAAIHGLLLTGDPRVLGEISRQRSRIPHGVYHTMFREQCEGNEAEVLFMFQTLALFRSDHAVYAHFANILYNLPDQPVSETRGIETWQMKFGQSEHEMLHYQSFAHFAKVNSGLIENLKFKEGNSIYMTQISEEWAKYSKTKRPRGLKATCLG